MKTQKAALCIVVLCISLPTGNILRVSSCEMPDVLFFRLSSSNQPSMHLWYISRYNTFP